MHIKCYFQGKKKIIVCECFVYTNNQFVPHISAINYCDVLQEYADEIHISTS